MTMWYYKWLIFVMCALYVDVDAVTMEEKKITNNRHKHLLMPVTTQSEHQYRSTSNNKLRHHGSNGFNDHGHLNVHANSKSLPKMDKFLKLKALDKRLENLRTPHTTSTTTTRRPYFFDARTKNHHQHQSTKHQEAQHFETENIDDFNDDYDEEEDSYVDEPDTYTTTTTKTTTTTSTTEAPDIQEEDDLADNEDYYDDEIVEERTAAGMGIYRPRNVQAEESVSSMTQYKWQNYGTRAKLEEHANQDRGNANGRGDTTDVHFSTSSAVHHIMRMKSQAKCRMARPRVINVQDIHQSPGKVFRPHCTVLHRCGDDTGCCQDYGKKCRPKSQEVVYLHFYVYTTITQVQRVERLPFVNHTECACLKPDEEGKTQRLVRSRGHYNNQNDQNSVRHETPSCKCPEEFVPMISHRFASRRGSHCICDCPNSSDPLSGCMNMKRGKEHLSLKDRKCILEEKCGVPSCEYDSYMKSKGRCPRKHEKIDSYGKVYAINTYSESDGDDDSLEDEDD